MRTDEKTGFVPYEMRTSSIQVISYENQNMKGFLNNPYFSGERYFENLVQMIFLIEEMLDDLNCPQRDMVSRSFGPQDLIRKTPAYAPAPAERRVLANFQLRILFRQNASWQGSLSWKERMMESSFRSLLELIMLLDSALRTEQ